MAHFAELDSNNNVVRVVVIDNLTCFDKENARECEDLGVNACKQLFGEDTNWVQTSYNSNIRYNYAAPGYYYDAEADAFISPQPYSSWTLNSSYSWESPIPKPQDSDDYYWDEDLYESDNTKGWVKIEN
jgi:hypothetical protein